LERGAFAARRDEPGGPAPVRTFVIAALLAGVAAALVVAYLPRAAGDRAPGTTLTGSLPVAAPGIAELEARVAADPEDIPTRLALADAYARDAELTEGRLLDAARAYQEVLARDRQSVPALNGIALILFRSGEREGAMVALDRVLALRPRDPDALFLKGLALYQAGEFAAAVDVWAVYLDAGEFHPAAGMVRPLYEDAREQAAR
ncbi:MAG TPA: tetratricopeptide repeat protein, partial [Candidatus Limnocylindrales bacterium]|nr:tetratricopeptide repeat protein [Candidatus Limnocylindrales bacterium]